MKNLFMTCLACLTLMIVLSLSASAQQPTLWDGPMQTHEARSLLLPRDTATCNQAPRILSINDPDHTGYPYINNWKGNVVRDPKVFLNDSERQNMTQARVDLTAALAPIFLYHQNAIRTMLTPLQGYIFENIVATQDMERQSVMTDWDRYGCVAELSQRLHLDAGQEWQLRSIMRHLLAQIAPVEAVYAARFDEVIASAEQRVVAERASRSAISTENK
jgi:hypothetical protein